MSPKVGKKEPFSKNFSSEESTKVFVNPTLTQSSWKNFGRKKKAVLFASILAFALIAFLFSTGSAGKSWRFLAGTTVVVEIKDAQTKVALGKVTINTTVGDFSTNEQGLAKLRFLPGRYKALFSLEGYETKTLELDFKTGKKETKKIELLKTTALSSNIEGTVRDITSKKGLAGVEIRVENPLLQTSTTSATDGKFSFKTVFGIHQVKFELKGYESKTQLIETLEQKTTIVKIDLTQKQNQ